MSWIRSPAAPGPRPAASGVPALLLAVAVSALAPSPLPVRAQASEPGPLPQTPPAAAPDPAGAGADEARLIATIHRAAAAQGVAGSTLERIARCESELDPRARNPRSGAAGLFQFVPATWAWASAEAGYAGADVFDPAANAAAAAWLARHGGLQHWGACARRAAADP
jgi:hypothetical protein